MTTLAWNVEFTPVAIQKFEEIVPKKFRKTLIQKVIEKLTEAPDSVTRKTKPLTSDREPFFPGRNVWQLREEEYRFFYEMLEGKVVIVFFVGEKDTQTTAEMFNQ